MCQRREKERERVMLAPPPPTGKSAKRTRHFCPQDGQDATAPQETVHSRPTQFLPSVLWCIWSKVISRKHRANALQLNFPLHTLIRVSLRKPSPRSRHKKFLQVCFQQCGITFSLTRRWRMVLIMHIAVRGFINSGWHFVWETSDMFYIALRITWSGPL